jgi:hypothetical protein
MQIQEFMFLAAPEGQPSVAQGETLGNGERFTRNQPWKGDSPIAFEPDCRPSRAQWLFIAERPQGFTLVVLHIS